MPEYKLPDVGEGLTEAEIVAWKVKVGDVIAINDVVVDIETAKSVVELPSPYAGTGHRAARRRGRDRRRRHADHRDRRRRRRSTCPTRPPPEVARARAWSVATRPTAARSAGRARSRPVRSPRTCRRRRRSRPAPRRWSRPTRSPCRRWRPRWSSLSRRPQPCGRWRSRRCASWPRTSASTSARSRRPVPTARSRREDVEAAASGAPEVSRARRGRAVLDLTTRGARDPRADQGRAQDDGPGDGAVGLHAAARHRVGHHRHDPHDGARRPAEGSPRVPRRQGLAAAGALPRGHPRDASYARDQLVVGRGRAGGRLQELRQPRHRRGHPARAGRAQRQGRPGPLAGRAGRRSRRADRDRPRGQDAAGRDERRHVHDHQRRAVRRRRRYADHQPGRVRDPVLRCGQEAAVGRGATRSSYARSARCRCPSTTATSTARRARASCPTWPASSRTRRSRCCSSAPWNARSPSRPTCACRTAG